MKNKKQGRPGLTGLMCVVLLLIASRGMAGRQSSSTVYQVTYADRRIVNLPAPPGTNEGVLLVTRISTTRSALPSYETTSTGNAPIEQLNPARTVEQQMRWDGKAWVAGNKPSKARPTVQWQKPQSRTAVQVQNVLLWVTESGNKIRIAQARLDQAKGPQAIALALRDIQQALHAQQQATLAVGQLQATLGQKGVATGRQTSAATPTACQSAYPQSTMGNGDVVSTSPSGYPPNQPVLRSRVSVGGYFGDWHTGSGNWPWPVGGTADIYQETPNPDYDTGPRVIIREENQANRE